MPPANVIIAAVTGLRRSGTPQVAAHPRAPNCTGHRRITLECHRAGLSTHHHRASQLRLARLKRDSADVDAVVPAPDV